MQINILFIGQTTLFLSINSSKVFTYCSVSITESTSARNFLPQHTSSTLHPFSTHNNGKLIEVSYSPRISRSVSQTKIWRVNHVLKGELQPVTIWSRNRKSFRPQNLSSHSKITEKPYAEKITTPCQLQNLGLQTFTNRKKHKLIQIFQHHLKGHNYVDNLKTPHLLRTKSTIMESLDKKR